MTSQMARTQACLAVVCSTTQVCCKQVVAGAGFALLAARRLSECDMLSLSALLPMLLCGSVQATGFPKPWLKRRHGSCPKSQRLNQEATRVK